MSEKPIIFSTGMVQAILDGRKAVTRRVVKPQPEKQHYVKTFCRNGAGSVSSSELTDADSEMDDLLEKSPYGKPGDLLYVRETFAWGAHKKTISYKASGDNLPHGSHWKPSIHMPKSAARIWLKVKNVRVERVQDISEGEAIAEGVDMESDHASLCINIEDSGCSNDLPKGSAALAVFKRLWDSINAKRGYGWDVNPWVWVVEFEVLSTVGKPKTTLQGVTEE